MIAPGLARVEGEAYRKQHRRARRLPPVYPLVLYHGRRRWHAPLDFQDLVAPLPEVLKPFAPRFTYIEQGREEGRQEGQQEAWQAGRLDGEASVLLRLVEPKFGPPGEAVRSRITGADPETLRRLTDRILTADSLDALLH